MAGREKGFCWFLEDGNGDGTGLWPGGSRFWSFLLGILMVMARGSGREERLNFNFTSLTVSLVELFSCLWHFFYLGSFYGVLGLGWNETLENTRVWSDC